MARLALLGQALLLSNSLYATLYSPINGGGGLEQSDLQVGRYQLKTNIIDQFSQNYDTCSKTITW